jgi:hypothetical protein
MKIQDSVNLMENDPLAGSINDFLSSSWISTKKAIISKELK